MKIAASPSISDAFAAGGPWMWVITLWGIVFFALLAVQYTKRKKVDFTPILWGLLASLVLIGPIGTTLGLNQAGYAIRLVPHEAQVEAMILAFAIAIYTTILSSILSFLGAILLGVVSYKIKAIKKS